MNTKKLKQLVLDLAIHGKLVPQDPNDEPASELLKRIQEEKAKSDKGKKTSISSDNLDEVPFEVPSGWCWTKIKFITEVKSSKRVFECDYVDDGIPFYRSKEIGELYRGNDIETSLFIKKEHFELLKEKYGVPQIGDILITSVGTIGNTWICDGREFYYKDGNVTQICNNQFVYTPYIEKFLHTSSFENQLESLTGTAYIALTIEKLNQILIPLPPLSEQKRIVSAIEKWFAVIDQLESNEADLRKSIEQTKKKVLDLAIHGKLVEQDENDEPASELLKSIKEEKVKIKRIKTSFNENVLDDVPFVIPKNWCWCRLGSLLNIFGRIGFRGYTKEDLVGKGEGAITLSPSNIIDNKMDYTDCTYISWNKYLESPEIQVFNGDILVVKTGSSFGKCSLVKDLKEKATINPQFVVLKDIKCDNKYLTFLLQSKYARSLYDEFVIGTAIPTFTQVKLAEMYIPLPPLVEQKRIVTKVEEVMGELDKMEEMMI